MRPNGLEIVRDGEWVVITCESEPAEIRDLAGGSDRAFLDGHNRIAAPAHRASAPWLMTGVEDVNLARSECSL